MTGARSIVGLVGLWLAVVQGVADGRERRQYALPRVDGPVVVDGRLDEAVWDRALELELEWEVEPGENTPAPVRTRVLLMTGPEAVHAAFIADDPEPEKIRARYADRDQMFADDWVHLVLDTFDDQRRAFDFFVNPLGVQGDAVETSAGSFSREWDAIWDSAGRITAGGYVVELSIPFSSLRFQPSHVEQTWGVDAVRSYPRLVRHKLAISPRDRNDNCYLCQIARVTGFAGADPGRNLEITPTVTALRTEAREPFPDGSWVEQDSDLELGVTSRWGITPNLALSATVNPDFSQVEADVAQLEVNRRFALFYPEKRPFFLEGADVFETPLRVVDTRTMVDPRWGGKLTGKTGRGAVGGFVVTDDLTNLVLPGPEATRRATLDTASTTSVARYRHDLGASSSTVGGIVTDRRGGGYRSSVVGADLDLRLSPTDRLQLQALGSATRYPSALAPELGQDAGELTGHAVDLIYSHATRTWEVYGAYRGLSPDFRADVGFVPRVGYRYYDTGVLHTWQQDDPSHWYNFIKAWVGYEHTEAWSGGMLRSAPGAFVEYRGPYQLRVFGMFYWGRQSYREVEYDDRTYRIVVDAKPVRDLELAVEVTGGDGIDFAGERPGRRLQIAPSLTWFAGKHLNLELAWIRETFDLDASAAPGGRLYRADLAELRAVYQVNRRAFFRAIVQYGETETHTEADAAGRERDLQSQLLFSYSLNPWTALYLGYSDRSVGDRHTPLSRETRTAFVKIGYAFVP